MEEKDFIGQEEVIHQEQENNEVEHTAESTQAEEHNELSEKELNIRALRESKEKIQKERDEAIAILRQIEQEALKYQQQQQQKVAPEEDLNVADDDLVEGRHFNARIRKLEEQLKNQQKQSHESMIESRLKAQYADFDQVVSPRNIEMLRTAYPEIAASLHATPDLYNKASSTYTLIKKLGIDQSDTYESQHKRTHSNASKPRPSNSASPQYSDNPLTHANAFANGLTDDLKQKLYREMMEIRKNS